MAGTLPVSKFVKLTLTSNQPGQTSTSISGRRQTKQYNTQFWTIEADYQTLQRTDAAQVMAFIAKQRGNLLDFDINLPVFSDTQGTATSMLAYNTGTSATLTVSSNAAVNASSVSVSSAWTAAKFTAAGVSASQGLRAGDFITFSNHYKTYQLTDDVAFDASGNATLAIYPNLIAAVPSTSTVAHTDVLFHVFLQDSTQAYEFGMGDTSSISLKLQESF